VLTLPSFFIILYPAKIIKRAFSRAERKQMKKAVIAFILTAALAFSSCLKTSGAISSAPETPPEETIGGESGVSGFSTAAAAPRNEENLTVFVTNFKTFARSY
jgi:hypothetical protein